MSEEMTDMRKLKAPLLILLTILLLIAGANLPKAAAVVQDSTANTVGYSDMQSVSLDLSGNRGSLSVEEKLLLLRDNNILSITEDEASMTLEEVQAAVDAAMRPYEDAGIFQWFKASSANYVPVLCLDPEDPERYNIFWSVSFVNKNEPYQILMLDIDDETGIPFSIRYEIYGSYDLKNVLERNYTVMRAFTDIYFRQLGWTEVADYAESTGTGYEYGVLDGEVSLSRYSFGDARYGEINIEFYVTGTGSFYNYFSD